MSIAIPDPIDALGALVSRCGGEADDALDAVKDELALWRGLAEAFTHPTAIAVVRELAGAACEPLSPNTLAGALDQSLGRVSYHVRQLAEREIIELVRTEPRRGAVEHFYRLRP